MLARTVKRKSEFPIDTRRIYVMGNSMGGAGTWSLTLATPLADGSDHIAWFKFT